MVAGLATVTPASGFIGVPASYTWCCCRCCLLFTVDIIRARLRIDDSLDVFAVHGVGGILGSLLFAWLSF